VDARHVDPPVEGFVLTFSVPTGRPAEFDVIARSLGLPPFLYSPNCSMIVGVGPDAAYLADQIASRATVGPPATALN
jgi:hypothetical protein